jgi:heme/copper-type cytochrome/quinol oxidase subunit 2
MGCIQVIQGFAARSIEEISTAMAFVLSSCFFSLLGMMLLGAPLEDRALKNSARVRQSTMSRVAWTIFPLVTLILIIVTFILVITPMTVPK